MSPEKQLVKSDIKRYASLEAISKSEGGQMLLKGLQSDILASIGVLGNQWQELAEPTLRATCGLLNDRLNLYRTLINAPKNKQGALKALEELLKQEPDIED